MKRSERLKDIAEKFGHLIQAEIAEEKLLQGNETAEVAILISIKDALVPVSCAIEDHNANAELPILDSSLDQSKETMQEPQATASQTLVSQSPAENVREKSFFACSQDPALGRTCQRCLQKIKVGDRVIEYKTESKLRPQGSPDLFYRHVNCESAPDGRSDFGQDTGGGTRVIRSTRGLGG
jgi:hypothetical protein